MPRDVTVLLRETRYWFLSDGGFFENTGGYELIRRRLPRIIVCDGSSDPTYNLEGLADLTRKVRIDFQASIEPFSAAELDSLLPQSIRPLVGGAADLTPPMSSAGEILGPSPKHAALFWIRYDGEGARKSVLLYLKASCSGDENEDVRHYHRTHPEFPHESTGDQVFDEAQWESYRCLGDHEGTKLLNPGDWFWKIPLKESSKADRDVVAAEDCQSAGGDAGTAVAE